MDKKCLTYIKKENQVFIDILSDLLRIVPLDFVYVNDFKDFKDGSVGNHHSDDFVLIITDIDENYFDFVFSSKFKSAFIMWINEAATPKHDKDNCIYAFKTFQEAEEFLNQIEDGQLPLEFKDRVYKQKSKQHNIPPNEVELDNEIEKRENLPNDEEETNKEGPAPEELITVTVSNNVAKKESLTHQNRNINASLLQKQLFSPYARTNHKMIGVWSPVHSAGVSTLVFNFALFLAKHRVDIAVLEGAGNAEHVLKEEWLEVFTDVPTDWISYAQALQTDGQSDKSVHWIFKDVKFFPLDRKDVFLNWDNSLLELYMTTTRMVDVTIVDYTTGEFSPVNRQSLSHLDELWIVGDHRYLTYYTWKKYIHELKEQYQLPTYLIMNQIYDPSLSKQFSKDISLPLLTTIPSVHQAISFSHIGKTPLYEMELRDPCTKQMLPVAEQLDPAFYSLAQHLLEDDLIKVPNAKLNTPFKKFWHKWIRKS